MSGKTVLNRSLQAALVAAATFHAGGAAALDFQIGENTLKVENLFTVGVSWRMQDIDPSLIGKSTLYRINNPHTGPGTPGLCYTRALDDGTSGAPATVDNEDANDGTYVAGDIPSGCTFSTAATAEEFARRPGSYSPNGDDGNLSFQKHDVVHAIAKLTSDISFSVADYNFFVRPIYYFDANYSDFDTSFPDTTIAEPRGRLTDDAVELVGNDLDVLDYNVSHIFTLFEHDVSVKVGNQVVNWGESSLLLFNSLNVVNAIDATKLRMPGLDLKELIQPQGMVVVGTDLFENISVEGWYQYEWKPIRIDPPGTYFSQSDTLGPGGNYAMLGFGKNPDDPLGLYEPLDTCPGPGPSCVDSAGLVGSVGTRTIYRDHALERSMGTPDDTGQYGAKLQFFLENFNNGTELALYAANYHSRYPTVSLISSDFTCIETAADLTPTGACQETLGDAQPAGVEPVPVNTAKLVVEYPEDIHLYGMSFNTTVGDYAISGEYAFRDNLPLQIHTVDLTFAALNPALPADPVDLAPLPVRLPSRREAFPDFVSIYRGITGGYGPNEYIRGYERLKSGQANLSILRLIGGDNPIGASQMTILFEMGMQQVFDMPGLNELQFQGGGTDTHISDASDGNEGINPDDPALDQDDPLPTYRQNPTPHRDHDGFGADESYGYRILNLNRWDSALFGANLETLTIIQHDVKGTSPGIGTNFVQGRKQYAFGIRGDYLSTYIAEVRYSWNTGGAKRDGLRDRDNIQVSFGIQF